MLKNILLILPLFTLIACSTEAPEFQEKSDHVSARKVSYQIDLKTNQNFELSSPRSLEVQVQSEVENEGDVEGISRKGLEWLGARVGSGQGKWVVQWKAQKSAPFDSYLASDDEFSQTMTLTLLQGRDVAFKAIVTGPCPSTTPKWCLPRAFLALNNLLGKKSEGTFAVSLNGRDSRLESLR